MHDKIHKSTQFTAWMQKNKPFKEKKQKTVPVAINAAVTPTGLQKNKWLSC